MNLPLQSNNVAHLHTPEANAQIERAMEREKNPGRTVMRSLVKKLTSVVDRFTSDAEDRNVLFIDHKAENITNTLAGLGSFSGTVSFKTGLLISNTFEAPEGSLIAEGQMVIIDEGAVVELSTIKCKTLINLGTLKVKSGEASDLLLSNHSLTGDFNYGSLHVAGRVNGQLDPIEQTA